MTNWPILIQSLRDNHLYPKVVIEKDLKGERIEGLEFYAPSLRKERVLEVIREVVGEKMKVDWFPNDEVYYLTEKK